MQNIARPSRSLLEVIKDSWIEENGSTPDGNTDNESQVKDATGGGSPCSVRNRRLCVYVAMYMIPPDPPPPPAGYNIYVYTS